MPEYPRPGTQKEQAYNFHPATSPPVRGRASVDAGPARYAARVALHCSASSHKPTHRAMFFTSFAWRSRLHVGGAAGLHGSSVRGNQQCPPAAADEAEEIMPPERHANRTEMSVENAKQAVMHRRSGTTAPAYSTIGEAESTDNEKWRKQKKLHKPRQPCHRSMVAAGASQKEAFAVGMSIRAKKCSLIMEYVG